MGILRKRDSEPYYVEEPEQQPTVILKPGGAMVDPEWLAEETVRTDADESRRKAEANATRALQEQDAQERREAAESMEAWLKERAAIELPTHLRNRGLGDA